jgi:hypothetical protein
VRNILRIVFILMLGLACAYAAEPPPLDFDKIASNSILFRVVYECNNDDGSGSGCSAGCASASFSPLTELIVTVYSVSDVNGAKTQILHYLVKFPEKTPNAAKAKAVKKAAKADKADKAGTAEGFVLAPNSFCGTVNMKVKTADPGHAIKDLPNP